MAESREGGRTGHRVPLVLRALGALLATYQLYAGDMGHPAAQRAVRQVRAEAEAALSSGPVVAEIRGGDLLVGGQPVRDDRAQRLARACYERRIEHVIVDTLPDAIELEALCRVLVAEPDAVEGAGGAARELERAGVVSLHADAGRPQPTQGWDEVASQEGTDPGGDGAPTLDAVDVEPRPEESVEAYYERLRGLAWLVPPGSAQAAAFAQRCVQAARCLRDAGYARFGEVLVDRAPEDDFAELLLGHHHDVALAALVRSMAAARGEDVECAAQRVMRRTGRRGTVVRLAVEGDRPPTCDGEGGTVDGGALAAAFPVDAEQGARLGLRALADYLVLESDEKRTAPVVAVVAQRLGDEFLAGRRARVEVLLNVLDDAAAAQPHLRPVLRRPREQAVTSRVVADAAAVAAREGRGLDPMLLALFGERAVDALVAALGGRATPRAQTVIEDALVALGARALPRLVRSVGQPPPQAARRLVSVLHRIGGAGVAAPLERLARSEDEEARTSARRALAAIDAGPAAAALTRLAESAEGREEARSLLRDLAAHPHPDGREALARIADGRTGGRHARSLRREARRLVEGVVRS